MVGRPRLAAPRTDGKRSTRNRLPAYSASRGCRTERLRCVRNLELVDRGKQPIEAKGVTPGQLALGALRHGAGVVPIPGATHRPCLEENVAAAEIKLSAEEFERIDAAAPRSAAAGDRYPGTSTVNR